MKVLLRRKQTPGRFRAVRFKLWAKLEIDGDEQAVIDRYDIDEAILIYSYQENRVRNSVLLGAAAAVFIFFLVGAGFGRIPGSYAATGAFVAVTWFFLDWWRETIYVKDLLHGRYFRCKSIEELVRKEHRLEHDMSYLRQVMQSAKHWGGVETKDVPELDPEVAKQIVIRGR